MFEDIAHDLRMLLREAADRMPQPQAVVFDSRTGQSTPESGARAGYDGHKRRKGSKVHTAVDTLGHLLALVVTPANAQDRAQVAALAAAAAAEGHPAGGGQAAGVQARLRAAVPPVGGGALLRQDRAVPALGTRLRAAAGDGRRPARPGLRLPTAPPPRLPSRRKSLTGSKTTKSLWGLRSLSGVSSGPLESDESDRKST